MAEEKEIRNDTHTKSKEDCPNCKGKGYVEIAGIGKVICPHED